MKLIMNFYELLYRYLSNSRNLTRVSHMRRQRSTHRSWICIRKTANQSAKNWRRTRYQYQRMREYLGQRCTVNLWMSSDSNSDEHLFTSQSLQQPDSSPNPESLHSNFNEEQLQVRQTGKFHPSLTPIHVFLILKLKFVDDARFCKFSQGQWQLAFQQEAFRRGDFRIFACHRLCPASGSLSCHFFQ